MAGWHLSRNRLLFFICALFITLSVSVHLTPYFPSYSDIVWSFSSVVESTDSCVSFFHDIRWNLPITNDHDAVLDLLPNSSVGIPSWSWSRSKSVIGCGFLKFGRLNTLHLLHGSWVVVAGDSQARLFVLALLRLMLESIDGVEGDLFKRHSDYQLVIEEHDIKVDFIWAPYISNLSTVLNKFGSSHKFPDVLVLGSGLWHMLHYTNHSDYGLSLRIFRKLLVSLLPFTSEVGSSASNLGSLSANSHRIFWLGMPTLINSLLNSEEKRKKMSAEVCKNYDREVQQSLLLNQTGGPLMLLDIGSLTKKCGARCTDDGMHYNQAIYEASLHIMLNILLIQSEQSVKWVDLQFYEGSRTGRTLCAIYLVMEMAFICLDLRHRVELGFLKAMAYFLSGKRHGERRLRWINPQTFCLPKEEEASPGQNLSRVWRSIIAWCSLLKNGTRWRIGDGRRIHIQGDPRLIIREPTTVNEENDRNKEA